MCEKLRQAGLAVRVFGYRACSSIDLHSFMAFLASLKMDVSCSDFVVKCELILIFFLGQVICRADEKGSRAWDHDYCAFNRASSHPTRSESR